MYECAHVVHGSMRETAMRASCSFLSGAAMPRMHNGCLNVGGSFRLESGALDPQTGLPCARNATDAGAEVDVNNGTRTRTVGLQGDIALARGRD